MDSLKELGYEVIALGILVAIAESMLINSRLKNLIKIVFSVFLIITMINPMLNAFKEIKKEEYEIVTQTNASINDISEKSYYDLVVKNYKKKIIKYIEDEYLEVDEVEIDVEEDYKNERFAMLNSINLKANSEMNVFGIELLKRKLSEMFKVNICNINVEEGQ